MSQRDTNQPTQSAPQNETDQYYTDDEEIVNNPIPQYRLSELCNIIPEYDGDSILLNAFINSCNAAISLASETQIVLLTIHIKNKLKGRASQLINSRDLKTWPVIRNLLSCHFGESRDINSLIFDFQQLKQGHNENPQNFVHRVNAHHAKLYSSINSQIDLSDDQRHAQLKLIDGIALKTLIIGIDNKIGQVLRAAQPTNLTEAASIVRTEHQLSYLENKRSYAHSSSNNMQPNRIKKCNFCKRVGHLISECRQRNSSYNNQQSFPERNNSHHNFQRENNFHSSQNFRQNNNFSQNNNYNRPRNNNPHNNNFQRNFQNYSNRNNQNTSNSFQNQNHHLNEQRTTLEAGTSVQNQENSHLPIQA